MKARVGLTAIALAFASVNAVAANCGHDVQHGAVRFEQTKLDDNNAILTYFSPSFIVMDNPKDPRHREDATDESPSLSVSCPAHFPEHSARMPAS